MHEKLERDRELIKQAVIDGYGFWLRSGWPDKNHSFHHDGDHYEWCTTVLNSDDQMAWSLGETPQPETVAETVVIFEHCPDIGRVFKMEPCEIEALLLG